MPVVVQLEKIEGLYVQCRTGHGDCSSSDGGDSVDGGKATTKSTQTGKTLAGGGDPEAGGVATTESDEPEVTKLSAS